MDDNNKRVIKNTLYLYIRQAIVLILGLLTTRIVLDCIGVENYGIYTVVGSFVAMFMILNSVLQSATRRFLSLAIGQNQPDQIKATFQTSLVIHLWIAIIVIIALETVGLWFLTNKLNINPSRLWAAHWVFQFSVLSVAINIISTPFVAAVTSHERFDIYAYMSIFDVVGKIVILSLIVLLPFEKLILYSALMCSVTTTTALIYILFCRKNFRETKSIKFHTDKQLLHEMLRFAGWDSFGNITSIINIQGITILINLFFGTIINAARGLANTVTFTVQQFVSGFILAAEPQLVKSYAIGDFKTMNNLVFNVSQISLFMLSVFALPIWLEMDYALHLWLGDNVPQYTGLFIKITILQCFVTYSNLMVVKAIVATGNVRQLNLWLAPIELSIIPIIYIALKLGGNPATVYWLSIFPSLCRYCINLWLLHRFINFPAMKFLLKVSIKNLTLVAVSGILPYLIRQLMHQGILRFLAVCSMSVICTLIVMWLFALNRQTKNMVLRKVHLQRFIKN